MTTIETTRPRPFVFVLMPFKAAFSDVYSVAIKQAAIAAGAIAERLDEQHFTENMIERIVNQIAKADLIIADVSSSNPNVFYELGYAHALDKPVIIISQDVDDIPFDLKHRFHIRYSPADLPFLKQVLEARIQSAIQEPRATKGVLDRCPFDVRVEDQPLSEGLSENSMIRCNRSTTIRNGSICQVSVCNVRGPGGVRVSEVYLLLPSQTSLGCSATNHKGLPMNAVWVHGEPEYGVCPARYRLQVGAFDLHHFSAHTFGFGVTFPGLAGSLNMRLEFMTDRRVFYFNMTASLLG
ncbi:MAG: hypothetical protein SFZ24_06385 [Planctomycetota bacterium]|nr:hypothetical protein [Planctomycetota bacterium]